jgi:hypothetical protein
MSPLVMTIPAQILFTWAMASNRFFARTVRIHAKSRIERQETMSDVTAQSLSGVAETLLIPLYLRAMESQRPDAMLKVEKAAALDTQMRSDVSFRYAVGHVWRIPMTEWLDLQ